MVRAGKVGLVERPSGFANLLPAFRVEPTPRWVRVKAGDTWIADSRNAQLLAWYGPGRLPTYVFAPDEVRTDLFRPSGSSADDALTDHHIVLGEVTIPAAARLLSDPPPEFEAARDHWTFTWRDDRVAWYEEALRVHVHARDPAKRVDVAPSERHLQVRLGEHVIAESDSPHALFETWLPTRWYFEQRDVRMDLLEPSELVTRCPYKGTARFWSVQAGDELHPDLAWSYEEPVIECPRIKGLVAFFNERVDLVVDGELQERPLTPWSRAPSGLTPGQR